MIAWLIVIHVICAAFWLGAALMMLFFVLPAVRRAGLDMPKFADALSNGQHYRAWLQAAAGLTIITGLIAFYLVSGGFNAGFMRSTTGILLSWGALAGILAIVGVQFVFRTAPPRNTLYLRVTAALVTIALICMVLAVHL